MTDPPPPDEPPASDPPGPDPLWRREFPYTSLGEEEVARRDFTRYLVAASGAFAVGTLGVAAWASLQHTDTGTAQAIVRLAEVPEGGSYLFNYPSKDDPAILVHLPGGDLRAYSQKCTHLGCVVYWQEDRDELLCPCHNGVFDAVNGDPIAGPPDRPLSRIDVEVRGDTVWATRIQT